MSLLSASKTDVTLVFDTSTARGGVAVFSEGKVLSRLLWNREVSHGELLTPALQQAVEEAGLQMRDVTRIAIGHGPGSFTGVRIAVNAARALGYALNIPLAVYDTTEILAEGARESDFTRVAVLVNAHKNVVFASTFVRSGGEWVRVTPLVPMPIEGVEKIVTSEHLCVGDGFTEFEKVMSAGLKTALVRNSQVSDFPLPEILGRLDQNERKRRPPLGWKDVQALYIRASGAEEKREESRDHKP